MYIGVGTIDFFVSFSNSRRETGCIYHTEPYWVTQQHIPLIDRATNDSRQQILILISVLVYQVLAKESLNQWSWSCTALPAPSYRAFQVYPQRRFQSAIFDAASLYYTMDYMMVQLQKMGPCDLQ